MTTKVEVEDLVDGIDFSETLTRSKFEEICDEWLKKDYKTSREGFNGFKINYK